MDTSGTYIKMCEKATEVQDIWQSRKDAGGYFPPKSSSLSKTVWLPRQDELQKMVLGIYEEKTKENEYDDGFNALIGVLWEEFGSLRSEHEGAEYYPPAWAETWDFLNKKRLLRFTSMEQLWLAFVMWKNWNKVWDGVDWINP